VVQLPLRVGRAGRRRGNPHDRRAATGFTDALLPIAAGSFLYIAASDLIPELRHERRVGTSLVQLGLVLLGVAVMALPLVLE
jgi:zinc transporter ZupT